MSDPVPIPEGTVVAGKLRIVRLLGTGGMGSVYEVEHEFTKHRRALKLLHAEMLQHPTIVARFVREASAAGHIGNPHIVETFDAGRLEGGEPYIVMEMLRGETLGARIETLHRLPLPEVVDVIRQACDGVQAAHDAGIVHRDLKPENLFLIERDGRSFVKILDFGVSKFDPALTGADGTTKEGSAIGTPFYMSPEQVDGERNLDARTDVYALGVILYQSASGECPFRADALPKLAVLIHEGKPAPLSSVRPDLPIGFCEVVHRAMARDRDQRYATARELGAALEPFGAVALDTTMLETSAVRGSFKPPPSPAAARSEPPHEPSQARLPGLTVGGSALSVANEGAGAGRARTRWPWTTITRVAILGVLAAAVAAAVARAGTGGGTAPLSSGRPPAVQEGMAEPPAAMTSLSPPTAALTPLPSGTLTPATQSVKAPGLGSASAIGSAMRGAPVPSPSASGKTPGSRAEQKGLARDNPF